MSPEVVTLITDGSADNRTGEGGWCAILRTPTTLLELTGWEESTTSNRMELMAAIEGLKALVTPSQIDLISDSSYLLKTLRHGWYERWKEERRNRPRPNMDLWDQLHDLSQFHQIRYIKIKGHTGDYWNERADKLAGFARTSKSSNRTELAGLNGRCLFVRTSGKQCKLHAGHSGEHRTGGRAVYESV